MGVKTLKKAVGSWRNYAALGFQSASKEKVGNGLGMDFSISGVGAQFWIRPTELRSIGTVPYQYLH